MKVEPGLRARPVPRTRALVPSPRQLLRAAVERRGIVGDPSPTPHSAPDSYTVSWFLFPPQRPVSQRTKNSQETSPLLPGSDPASHCPLPSFTEDRGHSSTPGGMGPKALLPGGSSVGHQGSQDAPQLEDSPSKRSWRGTGPEHLGGISVSRILTVPGTRVTSRASSILECSLPT